AADCAHALLALDEHDGVRHAVFPGWKDRRVADDPRQEPRAPAGLRPLALHRVALRAHRARGVSPATAIAAPLEAQLARPRRGPVGHPIRAARPADEIVGHQSPRRSSAPVGTMLPLVTSDRRASGTWFSDVPRIWRVASMIRLMP